MTDMRALYQEVILDHNRKPRNFGVLESANCKAEGHNPLCGDSYTVFVELDEDGLIRASSFHGSGCAISKAAASMMTTHIKGKTVEQAQVLTQEFREMMSGELGEEHHLGHLTVFKGVSQLPQRIKCAVLPWHALRAALGGEEKASTEGTGDVWADE